MSSSSSSSYPPPPPVPHTLLSFPTEHILLVTLNRPSKFNSLLKATHWHLDALWNWYDGHPSLRVAVITGAGNKAFCAGSDLVEIERVERVRANAYGSGSGKGDGDVHGGGDESGGVGEGLGPEGQHPSSGFAGLSRRTGKKVIIAAVNGLALGGGFEVVLNCDITISSPTAEFSLPEPSVGVYASGGGLPRLLRSTSLSVASDIALTGRRVTAKEALHHGLISRISKTPESLLDEAMEIAKTIAGISPDAIVVTRAGIREGWERGSVERAYQVVHERWNGGLVSGENHWEGLKAFREKRRPRWRNGKL